MGIKMLETLFKLILCHLVGDYVLQIDYIAKTKGSNIFSLVSTLFSIHSPFLYCVWFYLALNTFTSTTYCY